MWGKLCHWALLPGVGAELGTLPPWLRAAPRTVDKTWDLPERALVHGSARGRVCVSWGVLEPVMGRKCRHVLPREHMLLCEINQEIRKRRCKSHSQEGVAGSAVWGEGRQSHSFLDATLVMMAQQLERS